MTSAWPEQRIAETVAASGWIYVALEGRRIDRLHAQQNKGGAVALTQEAGAVGEIELSGDRARCLDARGGSDLFEIDPEAGVAFLIPGLAVMTVVDAEDRKIRRFSTPIVASAPTFINSSPSPVTTRTRLSGRASERPSPIMLAP